MSTHIPSEEMVLSEDDQRDIDKCVQQLVNRAAPGTVLQAKKKSASVCLSGLLPHDSGGVE